MNLKKLINIFIFFILLVPIFTKAEVQMRNYSDTVSRANGYILDYSDRNKYLMFNQKYEYQNGNNISNPSFSMGGLLSKGEFDLSKKGNASYLEIGKEYWTLTPGSNRYQMYYIDMVPRTKSETERSGARVTEFLKPSVAVNGKGTYSNPYTIVEGYIVDIRSNNNNFGRVTVSDTVVKPGATVDITISVTNGYHYNSSKDTCGLTKVTDTHYKLENINRDVSCTMIFEKAVYQFTLDNTQTYQTQPNPTSIYYKYQEGWYNSISADTAISSITPPTIKGYIFNGYKYGATNVIDSTGTIVAGNSMPLKTNDWPKTKINLTLSKTPITYTVTYNNNGGTGTMGVVTHTYDESKALSEATFSNPGYEFLKWNTKADGTGTSYTDKQEVINLTATQGANITLYAIWTKCNAGTYSNNSHPRCTSCAAGKYSAAGASSCTNCAAGTFASGTGNTSCATCAIGTYSEAGASSCTNCPSGYTSSAGTTAENLCYINVPAGKYIKTANSSTQTNCAAGKYSTAHTVNYGSTSSCTNCAVGTYSTGGAATCTNCPSGYTSDAGTTAENLCYINVAAGKYIATANTSTQTNCAAGYYKAAHTVNYGSTSSCAGCSAGTYSTTGSGSCTTCQDGYYCPGSQDKVGCPAGTEGTGTGKTSQSNGCSDCNIGYYSTGTGNASCTGCAAGKYTGSAGQTSCTTCQDGYYCPGSQDRVGCPAGTEGSGTGKTSQSNGCSACNIGYYSTGSGNASCTGCAAGSYTGSTGQTSCTTCQDGYYCPGSQDRVGCPAGTEGSGTGKTSQSNGCSACNIGHYSTGTGNASCPACAKGTYQDATGQSSCKNCPSGQTTSGTGSTSSSSCYTISVTCTAGTYLPGNATTCSSCTTGHYCSGGTFNLSSSNQGISACAIGKYQDATGQSTCKNCPAGKYTGSTGQSSCTTCQDGYYCAGNANRTACPAGTEGNGTGKTSLSTGCSACAIGFYSDSTGSASCTGCAAGKYTGSTGQSSCTTCQDGYYCPGSANRTACPKGYEGSGTGKTSQSNGCSICSKGYYASSTGSASCTKCPTSYPDTASTGSTAKSKCRKSNSCSRTNCNHDGCTASGTYSTCVGGYLCGGYFKTVDHMITAEECSHYNMYEWWQDSNTTMSTLGYCKYCVGNKTWSDCAEGSHTGGTCTKSNAGSYTTCSCSGTYYTYSSD